MPPLPGLRGRPWAHLPLRSQIVAVLGLPLAALIVAGALTLVLLSEREQADRLLRRAYAVEAELQGLHALALEAETGVDGFLLTGNEDFLAPFQRAEATLPQVLERIASRFDDQPEQLARLARAEGQLVQQFHALRTLLDYAALLGPDAQDTIDGFVLTSQVVMDGFWAQVTEMLDSQQQRIEALEGARSRAVRRFFVAFIVTLGMGVVGGVLGVMLFAVSLSRRLERLTAAARRLAQGLPLTRTSSNRDEIGRLGTALSEASALLAAREAQLRQAKRQVRDRFDELTLRNREMTLLNQFGAAVQRASEQAGIGEALRESLTALDASLNGSLYLREGGAERLELAWGDAPPTAADFPPEPQLDVGAPPRLLRFALEGQDGEMGALYVAHPNGIAAETQRVVGAMAGRGALALANLRLRLYLQELALRDPLTGLYNRRFLEVSLERELGRAQREGRALSVIVADLDHFKQLNDSHGHDAGDEVLRAFGRLLGESFRRHDIACRYGGEEFVVVLPDTELGDARARAERLGAAVRRMQVPLPNGSLEMISVSMGVAAYPLHGESAEALVRRADDALYTAKRTGRDRVVLAGQTGLEPLGSESG